MDSKNCCFSLKRRGFTRLEIILGGLVLLFIVFPVIKNLVDLSLTSRDESVKQKNGECTRKEMYYMPEEFKRALSIIKQRWTEKTGHSSSQFDYFNCVDIQYSDLSEAEGMFYFSEKESDPNKLVIKVNKSYKQEDDLTTALLLAHETTHVINYIEGIKNGRKTPCVEDEVLAFRNQLLLTSGFTKEEAYSLNSRLNRGYSSLNNQMKQIWTLLEYRDYARKKCNTIDYNDCFFKYFNAKVEEMVRSNPYYQKQCNLN